MVDKPTHSLSFLQGGGEMGDLIRNFNWANTSIGEPQLWPQSLKTTLSLMLSSKFPMFLYWGDDLIQFYNDAYRPSMGVDGKHPKALGQKAEECWPEIWHLIEPQVKAVKETGESTWYENLLVPFYRNGKTEDIYWTYSHNAVRGEDGSIEGILILCVETTTQVNNIKQLQEQEQQLRSIMAAAPAAIGVFRGRDLIIEYPNKTFIDIVGKGDDIEGKPLAEVMPELRTEGQPFLNILDDVYTSGKMFQSFGSQVKILREGVMTDNYYNITYSPLYDTEGKIYGILDIAVDVTGEVDLRNKLSKSEENLRNAISKAPVAMCIFRGDDHIVEIANERMLELWGKTSKEIMQKPIFEVLPEVKQQGFDKLLGGVYKTGVTYAADEVPVFINRKGKLENIIVNFIYEAMRDGDGNINGVIAVAIDVTEQVQARKFIEQLVDERTKELQQANKSLAQSNEELERFAYIASHDLQEPLRKVSTYSGMLQNTLAKYEDKTATLYIDRITNSVARMTNLVKDILMLSKAGNTDKNKEPINLNILLQEILKDFELLIEQKNAVVTIHQLPQIKGISSQISQVFANLISNALKFSIADKKPLIEVSSTMLSEELRIKKQLAQGAYHHIIVSDNGIGFDDQYSDKIFEVFQRLHGKSDYEGTGIGLALCKKIALHHGGEIWASSVPGEGSQFHVVLPQ